MNETEENVNTEGLKDLLMDYADDIFSESIVTEMDMGQLRSIFTTYCICEGITDDSCEGNRLLDDLYAMGERVLDGAECLHVYADFAGDEDDDDASKEEFKDYMYMYLE